jgi:hypothetical protein
MFQMKYLEHDFSTYTRYIIKRIESIFVKGV